MLVNGISKCMLLLFIVYLHTDFTSDTRHHGLLPYRSDGRLWQHCGYLDDTHTNAGGFCTVLHSCMHLVVRPVVAHLSWVCGGRWEGIIGRHGREKGVGDGSFCKKYLAKSLFPFSMVYYLAPLLGKNVLTFYILMFEK